MTKYKTTYIVQKSLTESFDQAALDMIDSGFSVKKENLKYTDGAAQHYKNVGSSNIGVIQFNEKALENRPSSEITFEGTPFTLASNESNDICDGQNVSNMNAIVNSAMLMHTDPKLTGNVKVVIDSKSNIYIDTFKVNDAMSKRKYRHVPVSYKDYYGSNLMSVFKDVTSNDFYDVPDKYRSLFTVSQKYDEQYTDVYRYGASANRDNLYKEALSILAPLKVGKVLPDFFVVFRVYGSVDESLSNIDTLNYLIKNGEQIMFYDFRENTPLGTYLRNIYNYSKDFVGYIYDSREDQNVNIFNGISIDRGVATTAHESTAFSPDILQTEDSSLFLQTAQSKIDEYYTRGYERHRLVAPDIVNFEFMFNDNTDQFSINTYFGLYLTENDIRSNFYIKDVDAYHKKIVFSDGYDSDSSEYKYGNDVIHAYIANDMFLRTTTDETYTKLFKLKNKFGNNVLSLPLKEMDSDLEEYQKYMSFTLHEPLNYGEHLRVICHQADSTLDAKTNVYEVVISNNNDYLKNKYHISEESITTNEFDYNSGLIGNRTIITHRIALSIGETQDDIEDLLQYELDGIYHAFQSFKDAPIRSISMRGNTISIGVDANEITYSCYDFQRITDKIVYNTKNLDKLKDENNEYSAKLTYFGENVVPFIIIDPLDRDSFLYDGRSDDRYIGYVPMNYEILGPRQTNIVQFIDLVHSSDVKLYELNPNELSDHVLHDQLVILNDGQVNEYDPFVLNTLVPNTDPSVQKPMVDSSENINIITSVYRSNLMMVKGYGSETLSTINLYEPYMLSESICGILPIRDFDVDRKHSVESGPSDEFDTDLIQLEYVDPSLYKGYDFSSTPDASLSDYLKNDVYDKGLRNSIGSYTTPSIVKWISPSTDASPIYREDASVMFLWKKDTEANPQTIIIGQTTYYKWRMYDSVARAFTGTYILTDRNKYANAEQHDASGTFYTKAYNIAGQMADDDSANIYDIKNMHKILYTVLDGEGVVEIDGETYMKLGVCKVDNVYPMSINPSDGTFTEDNQSTTDYVLGKVRKFSEATRTQEYNTLNMSRYVGDMTVRDSLLNGKLTIEDIVGPKAPNRIVSDAIDSNTLTFTIDGIERTVSINDTTSIDLTNYKNFNVYVLKSEYCGNDSDMEIYIDVINRDILIVWYAIENTIMHIGMSISDGTKYIERPTDYIEKDIQIIGKNIYLGGEIVENGAILYTDNMQISKNGEHIYFYNQFGDGDDINSAYKKDPTDFNITQYCKNNKVIKYVLSEPNAEQISAGDGDIECATFIRETEEGYKNYTQEVKLTISSDTQNVKPEYKKSWFLPKMYDLVTFNSSSVDTVTPEDKYKVFTNQNMLNIKPLSVLDKITMHYNKVTDENDYAIQEDRTKTSVGRNNDYKPMMNCFSKKFNVYTRSDGYKDKNTYVGGYTTGMLHKTFMNSLALNTRKNDISDIDLTIWNGVSVRKGKIYYNITSALINHIMSMSGYTRSWSYYKDSRYTDMKKFISDSIIPFLTIDNTNELIVYFQKGTTTKGGTTMPPKAERIDNVKREIIKQNGEYYVVLTPDIHRIGTYYITFKVTQ